MEDLKVFKIEVATKCQGITYDKRTLWIGVGLQLFRDEGQAVPCSFDEHIMVMERLNCEAVAYSVPYDPAKHITGRLILEAMEGA